LLEAAGHDATSRFERLDVADDDAILVIVIVDVDAIVS